MIRVVTQFADAMAERLEANEHKSGWSMMTLRQHLRRLRQETAELERAIESGDADRIRHEAADVGNFAAFIVAVSDARGAGEGGHARG